MKSKILLLIIQIFIFNCGFPNLLDYSNKWIVVKNLRNNCLYESSISGNGDLILFYKIKQYAPQELLLDYGIQKIENNQFLIEIYWRSSINLDLLNKFKDIIGNYPIISANYEINHGSWIRINNNTKISNYISQIDLFSYNLKTGMLKQSKSLIFLPVWNNEMYNKINIFFNKEINNTGSYIENKCLD